MGRKPVSDQKKIFIKKLMLLFRGEDEHFVGVSHLNVAVLSWEESHEARHEVRGH